MDGVISVGYPQSGKGWRLAGLSTAILLLLLLLLYRETFSHVIAAWNEWDTGGFYGHGYLVLAICIFMFYYQSMPTGT